ncbi:NAD(P)-binding protein [Algiphilus sp. NNCM1]|uniref:NAD(P)/FAD-dependent oxidoreductase n=1 Tax=Algiphilus sp. TaxID=1872431 RepID=UPI001CA7673E|nr:NAD(P)-binding protein [Algiphilus sp.]MBY8965692.1 NAD(P)-binding protein [Algiphilus acroporae]MCI5064077.1 NAD(P)-binding protein [Algiphilus sp.]MCI5104126.1 NAD(P)-binding protein [Algiphilus sp.]
MTTAIIGAGATGLVAGRLLQAAGETVTLFDKGRGFGGRMATRRHALGSFDHGAPGFRVTEASWKKTLARWHQRDVCAPMDLSGLPHWTGVGGMSAIGRWLARPLDVRRAIQVAGVSAEGDIWDDRQHPLGRFDRIVITVPAPQAMALGGAAAPDCVASLRQVAYAPCWTLMLGLRRPPKAVTAPREPLAQIIRDTAKPGRGLLGECWVAHACAAWSAAHVEDAPEAAQSILLPAFQDAVGAGAGDLLHVAAHRWRYARVVHALSGAGYLASTQAPIFFAGDYCLGDGVACAFRSAEAVAAAVLATSSPGCQGDTAIPK